MRTTELLKLIRIKEQECESIVNTSSKEIDFLTKFYKENSFGGIDGMLTMDLTDFVTAYMMSYVTNEDRDEAFSYLNKSIEAIRGLIENTTDEEMDDLINICNAISRIEGLKTVRDLFADSNRRRSKLKLTNILSNKIISSDDLEFLFELSEQEGCNIAELFNLYCHVEEPFDNALCMVHDMKALRDDYEKFNEALEMYGPNSKERKFLVQSFKDDFDLTEISKEFRYMRGYYEYVSKEFSCKKKTANKELGLYRTLEQKIVQAIQREEITDARKLISKIPDEEVRLKVLQLVYEHNKEYYEQLLAEYNELSQNSTIHYQRLLTENDIEIDAQTIMQNSVQNVKDMIAKLKSVGINSTKVIGEILQITDIETFNQVISFFVNNTLTSKITDITPMLFDKDSDEYKNLLVNTKMLKEQGINPRNFEETQIIFISNPSIVQRNIEFLKAYSFDKSIIKGIDYKFLLNENLLEVLDLFIELGLESFLEEDLSILNYYKNINRIRVMKELNIPITSLDELKEILTTDQFLLSDEDIMKYVEQIDPTSIKMDDIPDEIPRLKQFESTRAYNINGVILSKNRVQRNYCESKDDEEIENKLMYSILHTSIMTQTEYETVKQSLTNSLTYK